MRRLVVATVLPLTFCMTAPSAAGAQSAENVAVVINDASPTSQQVGEYYVKTRAIPASNVVRIRTSIEETIERAAFISTIEQPIATAIARNALQDRILYLVLTKDVPLRIGGTTGLDGTVASVDSELTLLYRRMTGVNVPTRGKIDNPYFLGAREVPEARPFTRRHHDIYLVTRLDAFTIDEALALVVKAQASVRDGRFVLDQRADGANPTAEGWLELAARRLRAQSSADRVFLETTPKAARDIRPVLGYYSWGSTDPQNRVRTVEMGFVPGSIAANFVGSDARTFREPPPDWVPGSDPNSRSQWFAGSSESLVGDLIRQGVTGVSGNVAEPYLQSAVRPEILFPAYLAGFNLVESFYLAMPHLSWQTVVVGDPLCAPFPPEQLSPLNSEIDGGLDPATELPAFFAKRRVERATALVRGVSERAIVLSVRAETLLGRGERDGARRALEDATELSPDVVAWQLALAALEDEGGDYDAAIARYRRVLDIQPNAAVALNNLAYALAVHRNAPAEALPLAKRAVSLSPGQPTMLDTLGWIEHLLGNHEAAAKLLADAVKSGPANAEIRLHAAVVFAATGAREAADRELQEALRLDPAMANRDDTRELRARIDALGR